MEEKFQKLFNLVQKNDEFQIYKGDDLAMGSVAPYGISSGLAELDIFLGAKGGFPASKVVEIYGLPYTGKSTLALHAISEWQKRNGLCIFIDTESAFSPDWARKIGCLPENIFKHEVMTVEAIFDVLGYYLGEIEIEGKRAKKGVLEELDCPVLFVIDSCTAVPTSADIQGELQNEGRVGFEAKQIKKGLRRINPMLSSLKCKPTIIFVNHAISKIVSFGKKSQSGGGNAIKFYSTIRIELSAIGQLKNKSTGERIGQKINVFVEKLRGNLQYPTFTLNLLNSSGFDRIESLKLAILSTGYGERPPHGRVITILPGTDKEEQFNQTDFEKWVHDKGGYDAVYQIWRKYCIKNGIIEPWGGVNS